MKIYRDGAFRVNYIKDLKDGSEIEECYLVQNKHLNYDKNGKPYLILNLKDKTGSIDGRIFNCDLEAIKDIKENCFLKITGSIHSYNNDLQLTIKKFALVDVEQIDKQQYIPSSKREINDMINELYSIIDSIKNENLKWLLEEFFLDEQFLKDFSQKSAAKSVHHNYLGGLIEHSLNVAYICRTASERYKDYVDIDFITTAALLHDIGKINEFSDFPENDYTEEGKLLGHISIGAMMIDEKVKNKQDFPYDLKIRLQHAILSHHGEYEYGSPKRPKTIEALILHFSDNMDAKVNTFEQALDTSLNTDTGWTDYNKYFLRQLKK